MFLTRSPRRKTTLLFARIVDMVLDDPRGHQASLEKSWRKKQRNCEKKTGG
jgi:hypothetical protein